MEGGWRAQRGVSPVVGVVLLVAIVVLLAGTVGVFTFGFSEREPTTAPRVAVVADYSDRTTGNGEYLNLSFQSGDPLDRRNVSVVVTGARDSGGGDVALDSDPLASASTRIGGGEELSVHAGHFTDIDSGEHLDLSDATLRLVWRPTVAEETESYVLYRWPDPSRRQS